MLIVDRGLLCQPAVRAGDDGEPQVSGTGREPHEVSTPRHHHGESAMTETVRTCGKIDDIHHLFQWTSQNSPQKNDKNMQGNIGNLFLKAM